MLTNRTSRWSIATALICVLLLAASWFLLISPRRADASSVREEAVQSDAQATQLQGQIAELKAQFADLPKQKEELKKIKVQLPPQAEVPDLVRDLRNYADQAGVSLDSLTPAPPVLLGAAGGAAAPTAVTAAAGSVVSIPLQIAVTGDYFEASLFVKNLQTKLGRSMLISGIGVAPAQEAAVVPVAATTATATATATTGATPAAPTATPTTAPISLDRVTLSITSAVFVLMDGSTTLEDVTRQVRAATGGKTPAAAVTPTPAATGTPAAS